MAGVKISALPTIPVAPALTDIFPEVQPAVAGTTYQTTFNQLLNLFQPNIPLTFAGNPNTHVAGTTFQFCWDTTNNVLYVCTTTGNAAGAVWTAAGSFTPPLAVTLGGTGLSTTHINRILFSSANNTIAEISTANNGALITSAGGVPSISSTLPSAVQTNITALGTQAQALNMGGFQINNGATPSVASDYATKGYVDQTALNGTSVYAASAGSLGTVTQSGAGVGATLTNAGAQATFALDGVNPPLNSNVLIKNTAVGMSAANEGIYTVTNVGSGASNWVLTRATEYDTPTEINNTGLIVIQNGSTLAGTAWYNAATIVTVDTTNFSFSQFGNIVFPITLANGGTNASLTASNGGIFYSTATSGAILAGTATAGLALLSGSSTTPTWSTKPPITQVKVTTFAAGSSTYTPTAGMQFVSVQIVGSGGGGGGGAGAGGVSGQGGGGGAGGYCQKVYTSALIGANAAVVVGAGGAGGASGNHAGTVGNASTFTPAGAGAVLTGNGGGNGAGSPSTATTNSVTGGASGSATGGDINIPGSYGEQGVVISGSAGVTNGGSGGASHLSTTAFNVGVGTNPGNAYGGGGMGAAANGGANVAGGNGADGVCIITEYISV